MSKLLHIQASPRKDRSHSRAIAAAFIEAYKKANPSDEIVPVNLFDMDLPAFDGLAVQAKYAILHGKDHSGEEQLAWQAIEAIIEQFRSADKYLFSIPMWNFSIPYRLKQYLDVIIQPGYTFSFSPEEGYKGLVLNRPAAVVYSRGGAYGKGTGAPGFDKQEPYMAQILGFMGFTSISSIVIEPTLAAGPDAAAACREAAIAEATEIGSGF